jgi:predicted DNA-binding transcriptional regulator YafY
MLKLKLMRADRLISILMLLQTRGRMTAQELANKLEVSVRTIYRDILALNMAEIPLYTDRGPGGGISLLESYRTSLTGLKRDEVRALFSISIPAALNDLGLGKELSAALLKLSAILPSNLRVDETGVRQRIHIDLGEWKTNSDSVPHLNSIQQAVWQDHKVFLMYRPLIPAWIDPLEVEIEPFGLIAHDDNWYLVANKSGYFLVIPVNRILEVQILEKTFTRPEDFSLAAFWNSWWVENQKRLPLYPVRLRYSPQVKPYLARLFGKIALEAVEPPDDKGWNTTTLEFRTIHDARGHLLALGGAVEVLEPLPLRLSMADYARQIEERYPDLKFGV